MGYRASGCLSCRKKDGETLDEFLDNRVFAGNEGSTLDPEPEGVKGFNEFMDEIVLKDCD